jgi:hypothetical protein
MALIYGNNGELPGYREHDDNPGMPDGVVIHDEGSELDAIDAYWPKDGNGTRMERFFVISLDALDQLYVDSPIDKIALRVTDFETPQSIKVTWMAFDGTIPAPDVPRDDVMYIVLEAKYFYGTTLPKEILGLRNGMDTHCITARPGRLPNGQVVMYLVASTLRLTNTGNSTGSPGLKIPSTP